MTAKGVMQQNSNTRKAIDFCADPAGRTLKEVAAHIDRTTNGTLSVLFPALKDGRLHRAGIQPWSRYFSSEEDAEAFNKIAPDLLKAHKEEQRIKARTRDEKYWKAREEREKIKRRAAAAERAKNKPPKEPKPVKQKRATTVLNPSGIAPKTDAKKLHQQATIIWPEHVQVQRAPTPRDDRFSFTPPPGWKGQITQDWMNRRLEAA